MSVESRRCLNLVLSLDLLVRGKKRTKEVDQRGNNAAPVSTESNQDLPVRCSYPPNLLWVDMGGGSQKGLNLVLPLDLLVGGQEKK